MAGVANDLDVAVIGNGTIASMIDRDGRHVWTCWPRLDGDPIFHALVGGEGGYWSIEPHHKAVIRRRYIGNTAILETEIEDETGSMIRITDFAPRCRRFGRLFRPATLMRRIEPVHGRFRGTIRVRLNGRYGAEQMRKVPMSNSIRFVGEEQTIRLTTDTSVACIVEELPIVVHAPIHMILGPDESVPESPGHLFREIYDETLLYWQEWSRYLSIPFEYQDVVLRAAITLKLCAFEETGGVVAALTTSIPEAAHSERNWDYRFCWLRDTYFTVHALNRLGATRTMEDYLRYITTVVALSEDGTLLPLYPILPGRDPDEKVAPALTGYRNMGPVRVGNAAWFQRQHDVYGSVVMAAAQMFYDHRLPRRGDLELFQLLERLGEQAARVALEPDAGIWEYRGRERVHTHSALMCWVACARLAKIAGVLEMPERGEYWRGHAARIRRAILDEAWDPARQTFVESFGGKDLDAALLLMHEVGFLAADDPRFVGTVEAIEKELRRGNHMFRYAAADDFGEPENAFTVCTFWFVDALAAIGRKDEARQIYEELISCRNSMGILSEDVNPLTKELWGNIPQTYSMVGLIISGMRLSKTWEEAFWRDSVIVSNRVSVPTGRRVEAGGLTVVLRDGLRKADGLWFGWSGDFAEQPGPAKVTTRGKMSYALLDLNQDDYKGFYYGFANGSLWPLFHYRLGLVDWKAESYRAYRKVNHQFAVELIKLLEPDDQVWVHDYQLIPLGEELRKLGFTGTIGFYLHVPFPSGDIVEVLPAHVELGQAMLNYDLIGVQTDRAHHDMLDFLERWIGAEREGEELLYAGRRVRTGVYRAAIDTLGFGKEAAIAVENEEVRNLEESLGGRALMLGVERLDYTKGLPLRFAAYEHLLATHEDWLRKVIMLQIAPVSRGELSQYRTLRSDLERATGRIAGRFASPDWNPIRYVNQPVPRKILSGYLRVAQVGLVTPLRDGMNLVAKEFVAAQNPENPGVLVLSRFAGAVEELGEGALLVNPLDIERTAEAMREALAMPKDERIDRWQRCMEPLRVWTARTWYDAFVHKLHEISDANGKLAHAA